MDALATAYGPHAPHRPLRCPLPGIRRRPPRHHVRPRGGPARQYLLPGGRDVERDVKLVPLRERLFPALPGPSSLRTIIVSHNGAVKITQTIPGPPRPGVLAFVGFQATLPTPGELHRLLIESAIALAIMAVVSIGLGWMVADRKSTRLNSSHLG